MDVVRVQVSIKRAAGFLKGMHLTLREAQLNAAALLAIHSAISYTDALREGLGEKNLTSEDHSSAALRLEKLIPPSRLSNRSGIGQLKKLLAKKTSVAYGARTLADEDYKSLTETADRFARWANEAGKLLSIEGWRNE